MNTLPAFMWLTAEEVVRQGIAAVERGDAVYVPGRVNRFIKSLVQLMPDRLALWLSARESRRYRNTEL
jgi:short-subunit dehydrogenase